MKKLCAILLVISMCITMCGITVFAENEASFENEANMISIAEVSPSPTPILSDDFSKLPYFNGPNGTASVSDHQLTMLKDKTGTNFNMIIWSDKIDAMNDEDFTLTFDAEVSGGYADNRWDGYAIALRKNSGGDTELVRIVPSQYGTIITKGANGDTIETVSSGWHSYAVVYNKDLNKFSLIVDGTPFVTNGELGWDGSDQHGFYIKNGHNDITNCLLHLKNFNVYVGNLYQELTPTTEPTTEPTKDPAATATPAPTPLPTDAEFKIEGNIFGSAPTSTNVFRNAFDGKTSTVFGGGTGGYCGIDMGESLQASLTRVRLFPRSNNGDMTTRHIGAMIQGANGEATIKSDGSLDDSKLKWETVYTITTAPKHNEWNEYTLADFDLFRSYRYFRYKAADSQYASVADIEFYSDPTIEQKDPYEKNGTVFGNAADYENAFDDNTTTGTNGVNGGYLGMDLGAENTDVITDVKFYPLSGTADDMIGGQFQVGKGNGTILPDGTLTGDIQWVPIYTISSQPVEEEWNTVRYTDYTAIKAYRYIRYVAPNGKASKMGELKFWVDPSVRILPDVEVDKGKLLYTVGCLSDPHIDAGIERKEYPVRQSVIDTCNRIKAEENANVVYLCGDITSCHCGASYTESIFNKVRQSVRETMNSATESGRSLYVTGNHEYATGGTNYNSGDYSFIMKEDVGEFDDVLYMDSEHKYLLAYHYVIDGLDFIGVNTPYSGGENHGSYEITQSSIDFVEDVLEEIGPERLVIFACHYPLNDSRGLSSSGKGMTNSNNINNNLKAVLQKHPNLVYVYGHDHGGPYIQSDTLQRVTPYRADGTIINDRSEAPEGIVSSFVGSMCYYSSSIKYNNKTYSGITGDGPPLVQALMIYVYDNCVELQMKNFGVINGGSEILTSYVFPKSFSILGMVYDMNDKYDRIQNMPSDTKVSDLISVAEVGGFTCRIIDTKTKQTITNMDKVVTDGMSLVRKNSKGEETEYVIYSASAPTSSPTAVPTTQPTSKPTATPVPTVLPTCSPDDIEEIIPVAGTPIPLSMYQNQNIDEITDGYELSTAENSGDASLYLWSENIVSNLKKGNQVMLTFDLSNLVVPEGEKPSICFGYMKRNDYNTHFLMHTWQKSKAEKQQVTVAFIPNGNQFNYLIQVDNKTVGNGALEIGLDDIWNWCWFSYYCGNETSKADVTNIKLSLISKWVYAPVTVKLGDVNGDNAVDVKDITCLRRSIAGGYSILKFVPEAADVNQDGNKDVKDITHLRRFIAGGYGIVLEK